jgi:hypothetical protein
LIADSGNYGYPWVGELVMGMREPLAYPSNWGLAESFDHKKVTHETDYGVRWIYHLDKLRSFTDLRFLQRFEDELEELRDMVKKTKGSYIPVFVVFDTTNYPEKTIYGRFRDELQRTFRFIEWNDILGLTCVEEPSAGMVKI